jgi:hypothetical protein
MKEVFSTGAGILGFVGIVTLVARMIMYYYVETVNDYGGWPGPRRAIESILPYDKKVRGKDEGLRNFCNLLLKIAWSCIGLAVIFLVLSVVIP